MKRFKNNIMRVLAIVLAFALTLAWSPVTSSAKKKKIDAKIIVKNESTFTKGFYKGTTKAIAFKNKRDLRNIKFSSVDSKIATVDKKGNIYGNGVGDTKIKISAVYKKNSKSVKKMIDVKVLDTELVSVAFKSETFTCSCDLFIDDGTDPSSEDEESDPADPDDEDDDEPEDIDDPDSEDEAVTISLGDVDENDNEYALKFTTNPSGKKFPVSDFTFSSSDKSRATVDANGEITVLNYGNVTITATYKNDSSIKASIDIEIVEEQGGDDDDDEEDEE